MIPSCIDNWSLMLWYGVSVFSCWRRSGLIGKYWTMFTCSISPWFPVSGRYARDSMSDNVHFFSLSVHYVHIISMNIQEHALKSSWCSVHRFLHKCFNWFVVVEDGRLTGKPILVELVQRKHNWTCLPLDLCVPSFCRGQCSISICDRASLLHQHCPKSLLARITLND